MQTQGQKLKLLLKDSFDKKQKDNLEPIYKFDTDP